MIAARVLSKLGLRPAGAARPISLSRGFGWWPFSKKPNTAAPAEDDIDKDPKDMESLHFLVEDIKKQNQLQPPLLPPKDPKYRGKMTVCVELEEVFLFVFYPDELEGYLYQPRRDHDFYIELPEFETSLYIYKRPGFEEFVKFVRAECEGVIFTNAMQPYADRVLDLVDEDRSIFPHRLYQDSCSKLEYSKEDLKELVKDLDWLDRDLKRTLLLDTKPLAFWCNPDNCLPVKPFRGGSLDEKELSEVVNLLRTLKDQEDVRPELIKRFFLRDCLRESNML